MAQRLRLEISVRIMDEHTGYSGLEIRETATITVDGFLAAAKILGQFHDLTEAVKEKK